MQRQGLYKRAVKGVIFQYDFFDRIIRIVPDAETVIEQSAYVQVITSFELLIIQYPDVRNPVQSESFQAAIRIITCDIPPLLGFFQEMRQYPFPYLFALYGHPPENIIHKFRRSNTPASAESVQDDSHPLELVYLRHVRLEAPAIIKMDGKRSLGVVLKPQI